MQITLEALGLTKEDISERVIASIVERMLYDVDACDEEGNPVQSRSQFQDQLKDRVKQQITASIDEIAAKHVLPNVSIYLENLCLQETNRWGEKQGKSVTFIEYLIGAAERFMSEEVDYEGKPKGDSSSYNWKKSSTRVAHLVHKHLQYSIETAMKGALADANSAIVGGLEHAVKIKLAEVQANLKVAVTTK